MPHSATRLRRLGDHVDLVGLHDLRDDGHAGGLARLLQELQALLLQPLEAVGRGARLEGAAAKDLGASGLDAFGDGQELRPRFDRAGPRHDDELLAADGHAVDLELRRFGMGLAARQLEGLEDPHDALDAVEGLQGQQLLFGAVVADHAHDGAHLPARQVGLEPHALHAARHVVDVGVARSRLQHDDHVRLPRCDVIR